MKFECKKCGECCKQTTGILKFLPLYEWEAKEIQELAREKNISVNIKPLPKNSRMDKKTGKVFCFLFGMFNSPCPFLKCNQCSIYEKRPLICRQFPILKTPSFSINKTFGADSFLMCPNFDNKKNFDDYFHINPEPKLIETKEINNFLIETYGDCFNSALQSNSITQFIAQSLFEYNRDKKIKLREVSEYDLDKANVISLFEFFKEIGLMDEAGKEYLISKLKDKSLFRV